MALPGSASKIVDEIMKLKDKVNNLDNIKQVYFLGIGGIGMSALARYFKAGECWWQDMTVPRQN